MQVELDGSFGDVEFARNHFVGKTLGGEKHDLPFAHAQGICVREVVHLVHCAKNTKKLRIVHQTFTRTILQGNWLPRSTLTSKPSAWGGLRSIRVGTTSAGADPSARSALDSRSTLTPAPLGSHLTGSLAAPARPRAPRTENEL